MATPFPRHTQQNWNSTRAALGVLESKHLITSHPSEKPEPTDRLRQERPFAEPRSPSPSLSESAARTGLSKAAVHVSGHWQQRSVSSGGRCTVPAQSASPQLPRIPVPGPGAGALGMTSWPAATRRAAVCCSGPVHRPFLKPQPLPGCALLTRVGIYSAQTAAGCG